MKTKIEKIYNNKEMYKHDLIQISNINVELKRINNSYYGNPNFELYNLESGLYLCRTKNDSKLAYDIESQIGLQRCNVDLTIRKTKAGKFYLEKIEKTKMLKELENFIKGIEDVGTYQFQNYQVKVDYDEIHESIPDFFGIDEKRFLGHVAGEGCILDGSGLRLNEDHNEFINLNYEYILENVMNLDCSKYEEEVKEIISGENGYYSNVLEFLHSLIRIYFENYENMMQKLEYEILAYYCEENNIRHEKETINIYRDKYDILIILEDDEETMDFNSIERFMEGSLYSFTIEKSYEFMDACGGFFEIEQIREEIENGILNDMKGGEENEINNNHINMVID